MEKDKEKQAQQTAGSPKQRLPKWIWPALVAVVCVILCLVILFWPAAEVVAVSSRAPSSAPSVAAPLPEPEVAVVPVRVYRTSDREIDFAEMQEKNSDIIAWIAVEGTNIDYPVVKTDDNAFYLDHDAYGNYYAGGALFTDMSNAEDFSSPMMLIYGHKMPDRTLFTQLHDFEDPDFFEENRRVDIYLPQGQLTYRIFAAYRRGTDNILYDKDFRNTEEKEGFLDELRDNRDLSANIDLEGVSAEDDFLVLSTCAPEGNHMRFVVVCQLVNE